MYTNYKYIIYITDKNFSGCYYIKIFTLKSKELIFSSLILKDIKFKKIRNFLNDYIIFKFITKNDMIDFNNHKLYLFFEGDYIKAYIDEKQIYSLIINKNIKINEKFLLNLKDTRIYRF